MSMTDEQLDDTIDQQLKLANRTVDMAERSLIIQDDSGAGDIGSRKSD